MDRNAKENILRAGPSQKAGESRGVTTSSSRYTEGATFARTDLERKGAEEKKKKVAGGRLAGAVSTLTSSSDDSMVTVASLTQSERDSEEEEVPHRAEPSKEKRPAAGPSSRTGKVARRKRSVPEEAARHGDDESKSSPAKVATSQRGGRQPGTGRGVDPAKASEKANRPERGEVCLDADQIEQIEDYGMMQKKVDDSFVAVLNLAISGKGGRHDVVNGLRAAIEAYRLASKVVGAWNIRDQEELAMTRAEQAKANELNRELASRLAQTQAQAQAQAEALVQAQAAVATAVAAIDMEEVERRIAERVSAIVGARIQGLEVSGRLLPEKSFRPSLEADRRKETAAAAGTTVPPPPEEIPPPPRAPRRAQAGEVEEMEWSTVVRKGRKGKGKRTPAPAPPTAKPVPTPRAPAAPAPRPQAPQARQWSEVVKRGPKKATPLPNKEKAAMLRPPRTAAVVITLRPAAEERGMTYSKVISEAVSKISLTDIGVPPVTIREAATGARVIEIPGEEREGKADVLASRLRELFAGEEGVDVSRPEITTDLRVTGLDDSIDRTRLTAALASAGGCSASTISVGDIRKGPAGMGTAFVRCPVTAAKKVVAAGGGRLLMGWTAAQVRVLDRRPRRCFRCLQSGHARAQCTSEVDRSEECYRCGQNGHKAIECSAAPRCSLCAAVGKPADHLSGGKACASPPTKKRTRGRRPRRDPSPMGP